MGNSKFSLIKDLKTDSNVSLKNKFVVPKNLQSKELAHLNQYLERLFNESIHNLGSSPLSTYSRFVIIAVVREQYDMALERLDEMPHLKEKYPEFKKRARPYIEHAKSLCRAIKSKRGFGVLTSIPRVRRKALTESIGSHFEDLRICLRNIEKIEKHIFYEDNSTTRWFVKVAWLCFLVIFVALFMTYEYTNVFLSAKYYLK